MEAKQKEYGTEIFLISDEPYRELAYDGVEVPYLTKYYDNTIVGYSFSKSLSLPGERIGYLVIPDEVADSEDLLSAANVATRILGFVNAPTLQQKVVEKCLDAKTDLSFYNRNREDLYNGLKECGFECIKPQGAFYLFVKSPVADEKEFCNAGKKYNIPVSYTHLPLTVDNVRISSRQHKRCGTSFLFFVLDVYKRQEVWK